MKKVEALFTAMNLGFWFACGVYAGLTGKTHYNIRVPRLRSSARQQREELKAKTDSLEAGYQLVNQSGHAYAESDDPDYVRVNLRTGTA